jgi:hypothetical protein
MSKIGIILAMLLVIATAPVHAQPVSIGTNFFINRYIPEDGDGLTTFGWPSEGGPIFYTFSPGLRLTFGLDEKMKQALYLDSGLLWGVGSVGSGESFNMGQFVLGYQVSMSDAPTAPYLTGGAGVMWLNDSEGDAWANPVLGGGLGLRHTLAHGKGTFRAELHLDRQFQAERNGTVKWPALTSIGLKLGFDLNLK